MRWYLSAPAGAPRPRRRVHCSCSRLALEWSSRRAACAARCLRRRRATSPRLRSREWGRGPCARGTSVQAPRVGSSRSAAAHSAGARPVRLPAPTLAHARLSCGAEPLAALRPRLALSLFLLHIRRWVSSLVAGWQACRGAAAQRLTVLVHNVPWRVRTTFALRGPGQQRGRRRAQRAAAAAALAAQRAARPACQQRRAARGAYGTAAPLRPLPQRLAAPARKAPQRAPLPSHVLRRALLHGGGGAAAAAQAVKAMLGGTRHSLDMQQPLLDMELSTLNVRPAARTHMHPFAPLEQKGLPCASPSLLAGGAVASAEAPNSAPHWAAVAAPHGARSSGPLLPRVARAPQISQLESELFGLVMIGRGGGGLVFSAMWQGAQVAVKFMLSECRASAPTPHLAASSPSARCGRPPGASLSPCPCSLCGRTASRCRLRTSRACAPRPSATRVVRLWLVAWRRCARPRCAGKTAASVSSSALEAVLAASVNHPHVVQVRRRRLTFAPPSPRQRASPCSLTCAARRGVPARPLRVASGVVVARRSCADLRL